MQPPKPQLGPKQTVVQRCLLRSDQHKGQTTKGGFSPYFHLQRIKARPLVPELGGRGEHEDVCFQYPAPAGLRARLLSLLCLRQRLRAGAVSMTTTQFGPHEDQEEGRRE